MHTLHTCHNLRFYINCFKLNCHDKKKMILDLVCIWLRQYYKQSFILKGSNYGVNSLPVCGDNLGLNGDNIPAKHCEQNSIYKIDSCWRYFHNWGLSFVWGQRRRSFITHGPVNTFRRKAAVNFINIFCALFVQIFCQS